MVRSGGRVVEGARLESEYTSKAYRGFESLPLRQILLLTTLPRSSVHGKEPAIWEFWRVSLCARVRGGPRQTPAEFMAWFMVRGAA